MKPKELMVAAQKTGNRLLFNAKRYSPELALVAAGVTGAACLFSGCYASTKLPAVIDEHNKAMLEADDIVKASDGKITPEQARKIYAKIYLGTGLKLGKLYWPTLLFGVGTVELVKASHNILTKRNNVLAATVASMAAPAVEAIDGSYIPASDDSEPEEATEVTAKTEEKKTPNRPNRMFKYFWGEGNKKFVSKSLGGATMNPIIAAQAESYFNEILKVKLFIPLFEVLDYFGMSENGEDKSTRSEVTGCAGWKYDPNIVGKQISFGLAESDSPEVQAFMRGEGDGDGVWMTFNCDPYIWGSGIPK